MCVYIYIYTYVYIYIYILQTPPKVVRIIRVYKPHKPYTNILGTVANKESRILVAYGEYILRTDARKGEEMWYLITT